MSFKAHYNSFQEQVTTLLNSNVAKRDILYLIEEFDKFKMFDVFDESPKSFAKCIKEFFQIINNFSKPKFNYVLTRKVFDVILGIIEFYDIYDILFHYFVVIMNFLIGKTTNDYLKELLRFYSIVLSKTKPENIVVTNDNHKYLPILLQTLKNSQDVECQAIIIHIEIKLHVNKIKISDEIIELCKEHDLSEFNNTFIYPYIRMIMDTINENSQSIFSIACTKIALNSRSIVEFDINDEQDIWLDIDLVSKKFSFFCEKSFLQTLFKIDFSFSQPWEVLSFFVKDVHSSSCDYLPKMGFQLAFKIKTNKFTLLSESADKSIKNLDIIISEDATNFDMFLSDIMPKLFPGFLIPKKEHDTENESLESSEGSIIINLTSTPHNNEIDKSVKMSKPIKQKQKISRNSRHSNLTFRSESPASFSASIIGTSDTTKQIIREKISTLNKELMSSESSNNFNVKKGSYSDLLLSNESDKVETWLKVCPEMDALQPRSYDDVQKYSTPRKMSKISKVIAEKHDTTTFIQSDDEDNNVIVENIESISFIEKPKENIENLGSSSSTPSILEPTPPAKCSRPKIKPKRKPKKQEKEKNTLKIKNKKVSLLSTISERTERTNAPTVSPKSVEIEPETRSNDSNCKEIETEQKQAEIESKDQNTNELADKSGEIFDEIINNKTHLTEVNMELEPSRTEQNTNVVVVDKTVEIFDEIVVNKETRLNQVNMDLETSIQNTTNKETSTPEKPTDFNTIVKVVNPETGDVISPNSSYDKDSFLITGPRKRQRLLSQSSFDKITVLNNEEQNNNSKKETNLNTTNDSSPEIINRQELKEKAAVPAAPKRKPKRKLHDNTDVSNLDFSKVDDKLFISPPLSPKPKKRQRRTRTKTNKSNSEKKPRKTKVAQSTSSGCKAEFTFDTVFDEILQGYRERKLMKREYSQLSPDEMKSFAECLEEDKKIKVLSNVIIKQCNKQQENADPNCKFCLLLAQLTEEHQQQHHS